MIPVIWLAKDGVCTRCRWDEWIVEDLLSGAQKRPSTLPREWVEDEPNLYGGELAVFVLPGGNHVDDVDWVNKYLVPWQEVVLFITSDEGAEFPVEKLDHPNLKLWIQTPRPEVKYPVGTQFFGVGSGRAWAHARPEEKTRRLVLMGQRNHTRRNDAFDNARRVPGSDVMETEGFLQGIDRATYLRHLREAWWAPAPSGVISQDSFRFYEALEMGAIAIPDRFRQDGKGDGYWDMVAHGYPVLPIGDWRRLPSSIDASEVLGVSRIQLMAHEWWHERRREMARTLASQVGNDSPHPLTVIIPTSPIETHPDTAILEQTVDSIRDRTDAEILITCDMPRPEMMHREADYLEYLRRVLILCEREFENTTPVVMNHFCHQVEMLRRTLPLVDSEFIMYVEHDTPLVGDIDFDHVIDVMRKGELNLMRFYHETAVHPEHEHLMTGDVHSDGWRPTMQWSQRPHVARRSFYEKRILRLFDSTARCMIEDAMFGIVEGAWLSRKHEAWREWRLALYHPVGNIQRSTHLDGRGGDPKFEDAFKFRYRKGARPAGAPA
jgi:hypothetical protein